MRHKLSGRKLNRTSSHRRALFMNMSNSLFLHEQIKTTLPKAKDLRSVVEKIITMAKNGSESLHVRRVLLSRLNNNQEVVSKLLTTLSERYKARAGGYTRVIKAGFRYGDSAPMAMIELVDRPEKGSSPSVIDMEENGGVTEEKKAKDPKNVSKAKASPKVSSKKQAKDSKKNSSKQKKS